MTSHGNRSGYGRGWQPAPAQYSQRQSLFGQPWFLAIAASTIIVTSGWMVSRIPPRYQATAAVRCVLKSTAAEQEAPSEQQLRSMILDRQVLEPAIRQLDLSAEPNWDQLLDQLNKHFSVRTDWEGPKSCLIHIGFEYRNAAMAQRVAAETAHCFVQLMRLSDQSRQQRLAVEQMAGKFAEAEKRWLDEWNQLKEMHAHPKLAMLQDVEQKLQEVEGRLQEKLQERDALAKSPASDDLPMVPALERTDNRSARTLAQQTLQLYLKQRADIAGIYSEKHPAVANLDRKIRQLAIQAGESTLATDEGIQQASFEMLEQKRKGGANAQQLADVVDGLQQKRQELREQLELKVALTRQLDEQRAKVDVLFAEKNQLQEQFVQAHQQLKTLENSNPLEYQLPNDVVHRVQFIGPDRRKWFAGITALTLLLTLCCWQFARRDGTPYTY